MSNNKRKLAIGVALISLSSMVFASGYQMRGPGSGGGYRMAQELNLSTEQQEQVKDIMMKHREEGQKFREQHRSELENKLSGVLTSEQLDTFKSIKKQKGCGKGKGKGNRPE